MSNKIQKLRARRTTLVSKHANLEKRITDAKAGVCATAQFEAQRLKKEKLVLNDEIAGISRRIAELEAAARRPQLVHAREPESRTHTSVSETLTEQKRAV